MWSDVHTGQNDFCSLSATGARRWSWSVNCLCCLGMGITVARSQRRGFVLVLRGVRPRGVFYEFVGYLVGPECFRRSLSYNFCFEFLPTTNTLSQWRHDLIKRAENYTKSLNWKLFKKTQLLAMILLGSKIIVIVLSWLIITQ